MSLILSVSMKCLYIAKDLFSKNWMIVDLPIYIVEPCPFEVMMWHSPCGFLHVEFHLNLLTSWRCEYYFFQKANLTPIVMYYMGRVGSFRNTMILV